MLSLSYDERQQGEHGGGHPDEAAADARVRHAATHAAGQRHEPIEAHPRQEEDTAVHVDLLEQVHEGAEAGLVIVVFLQVEHLDQRVGHEEEVGHGQVHKVEVRGCQAAPVFQVDD